MLFGSYMQLLYIWLVPVLRVNYSTTQQTGWVTTCSYPIEVVYVYEPTTA